MWEEISIPIPYKGNRRRAEELLLKAANDATAAFRDTAASARMRLEAKYFIDLETLEPKVYYNLTDNWIELHVRFLTPVRGVRAIKDEMQRRLLDDFEAAGIEIASGTYAIVEFPPLRVDRDAVTQFASALERGRSER
jgi:small-conductance mechanosensitive channel